MPIGDQGIRSDELMQRYNMQANEMTVRGNEQLGSAIGQAPQRYLQARQAMQQMQTEQLQNQLMVSKHEQDKQELQWKMQVASQTQALHAQDLQLRMNEFDFDQKLKQQQEARQESEHDRYMMDMVRNGGVQWDENGAPYREEYQGANKVARVSLQGDELQRALTQRKQEDELRAAKVREENAQAGMEESRATLYKTQAEAGGFAARGGGSNTEEMKNLSDFAKELKDKNDSLEKRLLIADDKDKPAIQAEIDRNNKDWNSIMQRRKEFMLQKAGGAASATEHGAAPEDLPRDVDVVLDDVLKGAAPEKRDMAKKMIADLANKYMQMNPGILRDEAVRMATVQVVAAQRHGAGR